MRLPPVDRDSLTPEDQAAWDRVGAERIARQGPYSALAHVPKMAERVAALEEYFRSAAALPAPDRELVILATAREMGAHYPWTRHEIRARQVGTRTEALEAVRANGSLEKLAPRERVLVEIARSLLRNRGLSEELFARGLAELGRQQLVEAVALAGHYSLIGMVVNAFDVTPPENTPTF
jgi:4-carboxymuconolactone decarboxylase